jgi:GT2 family glycosyltransferase/glycosyltransferase involved in cell wall biosynthesis
LTEIAVSFLRVSDGKVYVCSDNEQLEGRLTLEPGRPFERVSRAQFLRGINLLLDDSQGRAGASGKVGDCWDVRGSRTGKPELVGRVETGEAGLLRRVDIPIDKDKLAPAYVIYVDPEWGDLIPAIQGARYRFSARVRGGNCDVLLRVEFYDERKVKIADENIDSALLSGGQPETQEINTPEFIVPPNTRYAKCLIVARPSKGVADQTATLEFSAAMLVIDPEWARSAWTARPVDFSTFYNYLNSQSFSIYSAPIYDRTRSGSESGFEVCLDGVPKLRAPVPEIKYSKMFELNIAQVKEHTIYCNAKHYTGDVTLYIDSQFEQVYSLSAHNTPAQFSFDLPDRLLDGDVHLVEVRDQFGAKALALDFLMFPCSLMPWSAIQEYSMPPHPGHISPAAADHLKSMRASAEYFASLESFSEADQWLLKHQPKLYNTLLAGFENNSEFYPLHFPIVDRPCVSIIIPVHNKYATTFHCLCSLLFARNLTSFEVILSDDGSSDVTSEELARHTGLTVVTHAEAEGFIGACKDGAAQARGEYVLFLNNDTEVTTGWLDELVGCFSTFDKVGAAASKLVYPDGRLQDAGGIIWKTGNPWNYGRRANPSEPRFAYSRDADYVSGAALITPRALWEEIGGFADDLRPAYFEDTWYSFAVRDKGFRTVYCATSKVYHFEGISNGRDVNTTTGLKRFQEINRPKFKRRWAKAFQGFGEEGKAPDLEKDRGVQGRVLFIDWQYPRPDMDAGSFAAVQEMRLARALGLKITFVPLNLAYMGRYTEDLHRLGIETVHAPFALSLDNFLRARGGEFDAIYITRYNVAEMSLPAIKEHAPQAKILFCLADLHFLRELRMAVRSRDAEAEAAAFELREREIAVVRQSDVVLSYSTVEISILESLVGSSATIQLAPWVQDPCPDDTPFASREGLVFLGSFKHPPNLEAMQLFARDVLPSLRTQVPDLKLHVYGNGGKAALADIKEPALCPEGFAPSLKDMFARHRIFVAPLATGAGIKGKVISAMAHGIPTILSPAAAEGIGAVNEHSCLLATTKDEWLSCIRRLNDDEALWTRISSNGIDLVADKFSFDEGLKVMSQAFEAVGMYL